MAKPLHPILGRFKNAHVVLHGKFPGNERDYLSAMTEAHGGSIAAALDAKVTHLVLADLATGMALQNKAAALRKKGAAIEVMDAAEFRQAVSLTQQELLAILKDGQRAQKLTSVLSSSAGQQLERANLDGFDLSGLDLSGIAFEKCRFIGAKLDGTRFDKAIACDFSKTRGDRPRFGNIDCSRFTKAQLSHAEFCTHLQGSDFTSAQLENALFSEHFWGSAVTQRPSQDGPCFAQAVLTGAVFDSVRIEGADFRSADLSSAAFKGCRLDRASFRDVKARGALLVACNLPKADLSNAVLVGCNLAEADLSGAKLDGVDLTGANLRGATIKAGDLKRLKGVDADSMRAGTAGPALVELDAICKKSTRIVIAFVVGKAGGEEHTLQITAYSTFASLYLPNSGRRISPRPLGTVPFSKEILQAGYVFGHLPVRFETLTVESTKAPKSGKALRDLVIQGIAEAFAQPAPTEYDAAAAAQYRDKQREAAVAKREQREQAKVKAAKEQESAKNRIAKKIAKAVGKVSDVASFLQALELRIDKPKIEKATEMLQASRFQLFHDIEEQRITGVVKSQSDASLVYACRLTHDGQYSCCTQNLNVCGGLRGSVCKHLLVLVIGLVQAGALDPTTIDVWITKTQGVKSELDKEEMGTVFLKYKGAEAGEVDWRPTETIPEDFYAM